MKKKSKYDWRYLRQKFKNSEDFRKIIADLEELIQKISEVESNNARLQLERQQELEAVAIINEPIREFNNSIDDEIKAIKLKYQSERTFFSKLFNMASPSALEEKIKLLSASYKPLRQPVWPTGTIKTRLIHVVGKELWYPYYTLWSYVGHELSPMTTHRIKKMIPSLRLELERCQRKEILKARLAAADNRTRGLAKKIKDDLRKQLSHLAECPYCGNHIGDSPEADHIYPVASGGLSTPENLVYVCKSCNSKKSSLTLSMFVRKMGFDRNLIEARLDRLGKRY